MKLPVTLKVPLELLGAVAILAVLLTGITQTHSSVETQRKELARGSELVQDKVLESQSGSQHSMQTPSTSNAIALRDQVRTRGMKQYHQGESAPLCPVLI